VGPVAFLDDFRAFSGASRPSDRFPDSDNSSFEAALAVSDLFLPVRIFSEEEAAFGFMLGCFFGEVLAEPPSSLPVGALSTMEPAAAQISPVLVKVSTLALASADPFFTLPGGEGVESSRRYTAPPGLLFGSAVHAAKLARSAGFDTLDAHMKRQ